MGEFKKLLSTIKNRKRVAHCHKCGKEIVYPNLVDNRDRDEVLSPYCCTTTVFLIQWLIHHGWHVRNLGLGDTHPFLCPDCWEEGTPEYEPREYGKQWCEQAQAWMEAGEE